MPKLYDNAAETQMLGFCLNDPNNINEYYDKIRSANDFFDSTIRFFYDLVTDCYFETGLVTKESINVYVDKQNGTVKEIFHKYGGCDTLEEIKEFTADASQNIGKTFDTLKTYYVFRELSAHKVDIEPLVDDLKDKGAEFVLDAFDNMVNNISINLCGVNEPENLGSGTSVFLKKLEVAPDIGIDIPFPMLNSYMRGLRKGTATCIAAHTNRGKTRIITDILSHISVNGNYKTLFISTEQTEAEMKLQFLTNIYNQIICKEPENHIDERRIATQDITEKQREGLHEAALYFEKNCKIDFICTNMYDLKTLERLIKRAELKGCDVVIIDVLKPMRSRKMNTNLAEWQVYSHTVERLRDLAIEFGLAVLFTAQLKPGTEDKTDLTISDLALGTHIAFVLDACLIFRDIGYDEIPKVSYQPQGESQRYPLDENERYMSCKIAKNRAGINGIQVAFLAQHGLVKFTELGVLHRKTA